VDKYIGKILNDRYVLNEVIGIGGMAVVYKAYDKLIDRVVAVKVLKDEFTSNTLFKKRFSNESRAISMLSHTNIVDVYDVNLDGDLQYIVMEFINGITLKQYFDKQKQLSWSEALFFIGQILNALQHAHERGIVHRDIKPHNIMLLADGTIKVADFGIARVSKFDTVTMTEKAIGSVHYISPEQASGGKTDEKSDIYSLGVMLYEMLTGTLPFEGDTPVTVALMQVQSTPKKPSSIISTIPKGLEEITLKAMTKNPEKRYGTASKMIEDIDKFKKNPEVHFGYDVFIDDNPTRPFDIAKDSDEYNEIKKKRFENVMPIILGISTALVLFFIGVGLIFLFNQNSSTEVTSYDVPDFIGKSFDEVDNNSEYKDIFKFIYDNSEYSDKDEGVIIRQNPAYGEKVSKGREIRLTVSKGKRVAQVPDVDGLNSSQATQLLQTNGFIVEKIYEQNETIKQGNVIRTDPESKSMTGYNTIVKIYISAGATVPKTTVPSVIGKLKEQALIALNNAKLTYRITEEYSDSVVNGYVISQSKPENYEANEGAEIELVISKGKMPVSSVIPTYLPSPSPTPTSSPFSTPTPSPSPSPTSTPLST